MKNCKNLKTTGKSRIFSSYFMLILLFLTVSCDQDDAFKTEEIQDSQSDTEDILYQEIATYFDFRNAPTIKENDLKKERIKNNPKLKQAPRDKDIKPLNFDINSFKGNANKAAKLKKRDYIMTGDNLLEYGIINQKTLNEINDIQNDNEIVYHYNQKFTQAASYLVYGHHRGNNPVRKIIRGVGLMVKNKLGKNVIIKVYEGDKKFVENKMHDNKADVDEFLYWDVINFNGGKATTTVQNHYPDVNHIAQSGLPQYVNPFPHRGTHVEPIDEIYKHNQQYFQTIDINEAYIHGNSRSDTHGWSFGLGFESEQNLWWVGKTKIEFTMEYSGSITTENTEEWSNQVNSEIPFLIPNDPVPPGYSFRLHPVVGFSTTNLELLKVQSKPTGTIRLYNRNGKRGHQNTTNTNEKLIQVLLTNYEKLWRDFWYRGVQVITVDEAYRYYDVWGNDYSTFKQTGFTLYNSKSADNYLDAKTGVEIFDTRNEHDLLLRRDVPFKEDIDKLFFHPEDIINSPEGVIEYNDPKNLSVSRNNKIGLKILTYLGNITEDSFISFSDINNRSILYKIAPQDIKLGGLIEIDMNRPFEGDRGFDFSRVKSFGLKIGGNENIEVRFSANLL